MKKICVLAIPRTGTSYLVEIWRHFARHRSLGEIFHNEAAFGCKPYLGALGAAYGIETETIRDKPLIDAMTQAPWTAIHTIEDALGATGCDSFSWKVFPKHLAHPAVQDILRQPDVLPVFVTRRPIDSFISLRKASILKTWGHQDTTDLRVALDFGQFRKWHDEQRDWYEGLRAFLDSHGLPWTELNYETDIDAGPDEALRNCQAALARIGADLRVDTGPVQNTLTKQDRSPDYTEKVENWEAFRGQADTLNEGWKLTQPF